MVPKKSTNIDVLKVKSSFYFQHGTIRPEGESIPNLYTHSKTLVLQKKSTVTIETHVLRLNQCSSATVDLVKKIHILLPMNAEKGRAGSSELLRAYVHTC